MLQRKFLIFIFSFLGGVLFHSIFLDASLNTSMLIPLLSLLLFLFFFGGKYAKIIAIAIVIFILGFLRFDLSIDNEQKHALDYFANNKITLSLVGSIDKRPVRNGYRQTLTVKTQAIKLGKKKVDLHTRIQLKTYDVQKYHYGEEIIFDIIPEIPEKFETEGGRFFDYKHFLEKDKIYYTGKSDKIHLIKEAPRSIYSLLYSLKNKLLQEIYRNIPKPESSLLAGILLGEKTALGDTLENDFRTTGLMHIVVLSGYNVSIIIIAVMFLLSFLPLYTRSLIAVALIVAFALLVGAGPTVIRASIMALFIILGKVLGREAHIERVLLLAGALMVLYNPWVLYYDISFQFSFLATYGLIVFMPILEKKLSFLPNILEFHDSASATMSAQLMVMPLIVYYIGDLSLISVIVNMLVLFVVPLTMAGGFITALLGSFAPSLAFIASIPTTLLLKYILIVVRFFAHIPFAKFFIEKFSVMWIIFYYILLFSYLYYQHKKVSLEEKK